jgi:hypothetical protein
MIGILNRITTWQNRTTSIFTSHDSNGLSEMSKEVTRESPRTLQGVSIENNLGKSGGTLSKKHGKGFLPARVCRRCV